VLKHFLGKTQQQLRRELPENGSCYVEDFMWMTVDGLRYYLPAVFDYIRDEQSNGDSDFCSGLLCSLYAQVGFGKLSADVLRLMREIADYCDSQRGKFGLSDSEELLDEYVARIRKAEPAGPANRSQPFRSE
jgi:hypothetical protein